MIKLNLVANGIEQKKIKEYLENNASEILANKINNGVKITKDNKTLINKKDLNGFWKFATEEARKLAEKNARGAYVDDATVYGWAIHYFEEESIEGNLYNEDGTEFKIAPKITTTPKAQPKKEKPKEEKLQASLFDMLTENEPKQEIEVIEEVKEEPIIQKENLIINTETGEVITQNNQINPFDDEVTTSLFSLFENTMEVK